jgi:hypothetical protein
VRASSGCRATASRRRPAARGRDSGRRIVRTHGRGDDYLAPHGRAIDGREAVVSKIFLSKIFVSKIFVSKIFPGKVMVQKVSQ